MATQNNVHISDELLAELRTKAEAEGKSVDELAEEALKKAWKIAHGRISWNMAGNEAAHRVTAKMTFRVWLRNGVVSSATGEKRYSGFRIYRVCNPEASVRG